MSRIKNLSAAALLIFITVSAIIPFSTSVFAAKHCHKNCISSDFNCDTTSKVSKHSSHNKVGPTNLECNNNSTIISDSTITRSTNGTNNGDFTSPTVVSTDPKDNDNNVSPDTKTLTVTFSENIDKNTVDTGSLTLDPNVGTGPTVQSVSVSGKTATFTINGLLPNVDYLATISSSIEDTSGNFLDCAASSAVDSLCQWNFSTSGATTSPAIIINPTSGPVGTSVTVNGTAFIPNADVTIKFDEASGTDVTDTNGAFSFTFSVPRSTPGEHTVSASQPAILVSKIFTVTNSTSSSIAQQSSTDPFALSQNTISSLVPTSPF